MVDQAANKQVEMQVFKPCTNTKLHYVTCISFWAWEV